MIKMPRFPILEKIEIILGIVLLFFAVFYYGASLVKVIRITTAAHEYTKGIPIDVSHGRTATITYVYYVNGAEYAAKMDTTIFYTIRREYTVIYMRANPAVSVLKEHVIGITIEDSAFFIFFTISVFALLYCAVRKRWRAYNAWLETMFKDA